MMTIVAAAGAAEALADLVKAVVVMAETMKAEAFAGAAAGAADGPDACSITVNSGS